MPASGHVRTKFDVCVRSAYPSIADSWRTSQHVGVGPVPDSMHCNVIEDFFSLEHARKTASRRSLQSPIRRLS